MKINEMKREFNPTYYIKTMFEKHKTEVFTSKQVQEQILKDFNKNLPLSLVRSLLSIGNYPKLNITKKRLIFGTEKAIKKAEEYLNKLKKGGKECQQ